MDELEATLTDVLTSEWQVVGRLNANPTSPSIDIYPADPFRSTDAAGFGETSGALLFTVRARISTQDNEAAQDTLLELMDDESAYCVAAALMDDQTLNGLASSVDVEGPSGFVSFVDSGGEGALLGVTWQAEIMNVIT